MALPTPLSPEIPEEPLFAQREEESGFRRIRKRTLAYARPDITEEEIAAVNRVLRSGWLTSGPEVKHFEEEFAAFVGARHAIAVNSATAALHLGMVACDLQPEDAVLVPSITFTATAEVATYNGAIPLILDVDRSDYLLTAEGIEAFIQKECDWRKGELIHNATGRRVRAVIPVHLGGRSCDMDRIRSLAQRYNLRTVEDAAHAFPTRFKDTMIGNAGEMTAFSFYATKNLTTGEGGMLTTNDDAIAERLRRVRLHGIQGQTYGRKRWHYDVVDRGYKYNLTDMAAAMGRVQLARTWEMHAKRKAIHDRYREALCDLPGLRLLPESPYLESYHLFTVEVTPEARINRNRFVEELYARGIATSLHFIPLYRHTFYRREFGYRPEDFPVSEEIYERIVSLPLYSSMGMEDVEDVIFAVKETLGS